MNNKLTKQAKLLGCNNYLSMDIFFSQHEEKELVQSQVEKNETGICIKRYNVSQIPVKNAMRPMHKMIDPKYLCL